jgi:hypothetical protein
MPHYGTLRDYRFEGSDDVRGAEVYGVNDEKLGKVEDVIFDHSSGEIRYVVVDTGGLLKSKKFLVPINRIQPYGNQEDKFYAELDEERIQMLPEFNDDMLKSETNWGDYEKRYQERWTTSGDVMRNRDTGRVLTPPADQVVATRSSALSEQGKQSLQRDFTPERVGQQDDLLGVANAGDDVMLRPKKPSVAGREDAIRAQREDALRREKDRVQPGAEELPEQPLSEPTVYKLDPNASAQEPSYGRRWIGFQKKLREGRDKVVADCPLCGTQKKVA